MCMHRPSPLLQDPDPLRLWCTDSNSVLGHYGSTGERHQQETSTPVTAPPPSLVPSLSAPDFCRLQYNKSEGKA